MVKSERTRRRVEEETMKVLKREQGLSTREVFLRMKVNGSKGKVGCNFGLSISRVGQILVRLHRKGLVEREKRDSATNWRLTV